jgi:hypothetical protein
MQNNITVNDIRNKVFDLKNQIENFEDSKQKEIFLEYDKIEEIKKVLSDLENFVGGYYSFDECGELIYRIKIPRSIIDLPFINDYLTQDYAFIDNKFLATGCGECIAINYSHGKSIFIFDRSAHVKILEKNLAWYDEIYISAKIEEYQKSIGVFGDVVVIDNYYGAYCKHHERHKEVNESNYKEIIERYEAENLNNEEEN